MFVDEGLVPALRVQPWVRIMVRSGHYYGPLKVLISNTQHLRLFTMNEQTGK